MSYNVELLGELANIIANHYPNKINITEVLLTMNELSNLLLLKPKKERDYEELPINEDSSIIKFQIDEDSKIDLI